MRCAPAIPASRSSPSGIIFVSASDHAPTWITFDTGDLTKATTPGTTAAQPTAPVAAAPAKKTAHPGEEVRVA